MTFLIESTIGYAVNRCAILMRAELVARFRTAGYELTAEEWAILARLWRQDGLSQGELADLTIKDKTTMVRFIDRLASKGWVERRAAAADKRVNAIFLTGAGQALSQPLIAIAQGLLTEISGNIDSASMQTTYKTLRTIEAQLLNLEKTASL